MTTDLLSAEREYVEKAREDVTAGGYFARLDLQTLSNMGRETAMFAKRFEELQGRLWCAEPVPHPPYTIKAALAEALEPFMSAEAYRVFSAAVEGK